MESEGDRHAQRRTSAAATLRSAPAGTAARLQRAAGLTAARKLLRPAGRLLPAPAPPVNATLILVFGLIGIVFGLTCGIGGFFGIAAWVMGNSALRTLETVGDPLNQRGTVQAGRICGIVGTVLMALVFVFFVGMMAVGFYSEKHP